MTDDERDAQTYRSMRPGRRRLLDDVGDLAEERGRARCSPSERRAPGPSAMNIVPRNEPSRSSRTSGATSSSAQLVGNVELSVGDLERVDELGQRRVDGGEPGARPGSGRMPSATSASMPTCSIASSDSIGSAPCDDASVTAATSRSRRSRRAARSRATRRTRRPLEVLDGRRRASVTVRSAIADEAGPPGDVEDRRSAAGTARTRRMISISSDGFTAERASSRMSTRGWATSARASETRWRCPPDTVRPRSPTRPSSPPSARR